MKVFIPLRHMKAVLAMRFGVLITQNHQRIGALEEATFDKEGTDKQRGDEKDEKGRKHYLGTLVFPKENQEDGEHRCEGRFVIEPKPEEKEIFFDVVITALRKDSENLRSDITITKVLEGMLKKQKISIHEVINFLYPAYINGKIKDWSDLDDILEEEIKPSRQKSNALVSDSKSDKAILENKSEIIKSIDDVDVVGDDDGDDESAKLPKFQKMDLPNVKYSYIMADAYVIDVGREDDYIWVKVINSDGEEEKLQSFRIREHLRHHHDRTFEYLKSRIGERAFIAVWDNKEYENYKGVVLAESVTSIALSLMRD